MLSSLTGAEPFKSVQPTTPRPATPQENTAYEALLKIDWHLVCAKVMNCRIEKKRRIPIERIVPEARFVADLGLDQ